LREKKLTFGIMISTEQINPELKFTTSRSGGPGGQNVNKVETKVTLRWDVADSTVLTAEQKEIILKKLASRINAEGELMLSAQEKRSQLENKAEVIEKLQKLLTKAFEKKKARRATKPTKGSVQKRIEQKKKHGEKKKWRKDI
jgi:ribosome-associated protein